MITVQEIEHLALLARMELTASEATQLSSDVSSILEYVGHIQDVKDEAGAATVPPLHNVMRKDIPTYEAREYTEAILQNAPSTEGDYIKVKKIL